VPSLHALLCDIYYWQSYARNAYDAMDQVRRHFNKTMGQSTCVPPVVGAPDSGPLGACVVQPFGMLLYKEQCSDMYRELWRRYLNPGPNSLKLPPLCYEEIFFAPRPPFQQVRSVGEAQNHDSSQEPGKNKNARTSLTADGFSSQSLMPWSPGYSGFEGQETMLATANKLHLRTAPRPMEADFISVVNRIFRKIDEENHSNERLWKVAREVWTPEKRQKMWVLICYEDGYDARYCWLANTFGVRLFASIERLCVAETLYRRETNRTTIKYSLQVRAERVPVNKKTDCLLTRLPKQRILDEDPYDYLALEIYFECVKRKRGLQLFYLPRHIAEKQTRLFHELYGTQPGEELHPDAGLYWYCSNCNHVKTNVYDFILRRSKRKKKKKKKPGNSNTTSVNAGLAVGGTSFSAAHLERKRRAGEALIKKQEDAESDSENEEDEEEEEEENQEDELSSSSDSDSSEEEEEEAEQEPGPDDKKTVHPASLAPGLGEASAPLVVTVKLANVLFASSERLCKYSLYSVGTCINLATGGISCAKKASRNNPKKRSSATDMVSQLTRSRKTEANEKRKKFKDERKKNEMERCVGTELSPFWVIGKVFYTKATGASWCCACCGTLTAMTRYHLELSGGQQNCGCQRNRFVVELLRKKRTERCVLCLRETSEFEQRFVLDDEDPRATKLRYVPLCQQHADMWGDQLNQTRRDQEILRLSEQRDVRAIASTKKTLTFYPLRHSATTTDASASTAARASSSRRACAPAPWTLAASSLWTEGAPPSSTPRRPSAQSSTGSRADRSSSAEAASTRNRPRNESRSRGPLITSPRTAAERCQPTPTTGASETASDTFFVLYHVE